MAPPMALLLLCVFSSLTAVSSCNIQVAGNEGIGIYQDGLNSNPNATVWKAFYAEEKGTTFFTAVPDDVYISIFVGNSESFVESERVLAAPGTVWTGRVDNGKITKKFTQTGKCTSAACVLATVTSDQTSFGDDVWVRVYKDDVVMANYSIPAPGVTARFQIDQTTLYFLWGQREAQVPVTKQMRANAFRVDLTACRYDPTEPVVLKFFSTNTPPYYTVEQPRLDPLGSGCGVPNGPDCVSVNFNGKFSRQTQVAVFAKDQQWLDRRSEPYRPMVWQKLALTQETGEIFNMFPYDPRLFVGSLVFTTEPPSELNYIITGPQLIQVGEVFKASTDAGGMPQLVFDSAKSQPDTVTIRTTDNWQPKYPNTLLVVIKNGVPIAASGVMKPNEDFVFQPTPEYISFRGNDQFTLFQKLQDSDIDKATTFFLESGRKFLGVNVGTNNVLGEFFASDRCGSNPCKGRGNCNVNTGLCECHFNGKGVNCDYPANNCDGIDCGVHGYCSVNADVWQCNCVDQWSGKFCHLAPGNTAFPTPPTPRMPERKTIA